MYNLNALYIMNLCERLVFRKRINMAAGFSITESKVKM